MGNMNRIGIFVTMMMAVALTAAARAGESGEVVKIGVCLSFSGEFESYGHINKAGMDLFLQDYERRGMRPRLELVVRDDASDPQKAAQIVDELAAEGVQVILGPVTSNIMLAMIERAKVHGIVLISPAATSPQIGRPDDWSFKVLPADDYQGAALARFFARQMGVTRAAVMINDAFTYGNFIHTTFAETFARNGGTVVAEERYNWNLDEGEQPDFGPMLQRIQAKNPEMLLLPGYAKEGVAIIREAERLGVEPIFCGGDSWLNHSEIFQAGPKLDDSYYIGGAEIYANTPVARKFVELLDNSTDPRLEPYSVNGYDVMMLVEDAVRSGARRAEEIRRHLATMRNFQLAAGDITYNDEGATAKTLFIYRISAMGDEFYAEMVAQIDPE